VSLFSVFIELEAFVGGVTDHLSCDLVASLIEIDISVYQLGSQACRVVILDATR